MPALYQKRGRWYADFTDFRDQGGKQEALIPDGERFATKNRGLAQRLFDRRHAELLAKRVAKSPIAEREPASGDITFEDMLRAFADSKSPFLNPHEDVNRARYRKIISNAIPRGLLARNLSVAHLEKLICYLKDEAVTADGRFFSESYQHKILDYARQGIRWGRRHGHLRNSVWEDVDESMLPGVAPERETQFYTVPEAARILEALKPAADWPKRIPPYLFEQVAFALLTGARRNEIMAQRWEWIDWDRGLVRIITSKRQRGRHRDRPSKLLMRSIPLWSQLRSILLNYRHRVGADEEGLLFPKLRSCARASRYGTQIERGGIVRKSLVGVLGKRGVIENGLVFGKPGFSLSWREFRVTYCATRLQTVDPVAGHVGEWVPVALRTVELEMGHASEQMIRRVYGRVAEGPQLRLPQVQYCVGTDQLQRFGAP